MDFELEKNTYNSFKKMISSCIKKKDHELEVRFGKYNNNNNSFSPGVNYEQFKKKDSRKESKNSICCT